MNVTCDKCGKKYVISDDKVAGKASVKIRCKQCQNLISVTVAGAGVAQAVAPQPSPWEEESTRAMPPLDTTAQWFAMLAGKQQGPFDLVELQRRFQEGEVTLRTYLWKAGMGDWKRASDVPEVSPVFAGVNVAAPPLPPPPPPRPPSRTAAPVQRDVALSNEVPSPGLTNRPSAQSGTGAVATGRASNQPLNDLFGDVSGLHDLPKRDLGTAEPTLGEARDEEPQADIDPFAALSEGDGKEPPPPGETTRFFIAQAGVNKRNPPWKIALFTVAFVGGPLLLIYILNTFEIVSLPTVTRTDENGQEVQESFFSAGGVGGLKDLLTGDEKKRRDAAEKQRLAQAAIAAARVKPGTKVKPDEPEVVVPRVQDPNLAAFYQDDDRKQVGPKVRKTGEEGSGTAVNTSGLSAEAVSKVVADKSKAFQTCIDNALRRNPNMSVGNITIILNVAPSGVVKSAGVEPKKHEITDWGQCMMNTGKRIIFPGSDGETQLELPFKVGVTVAP